MTKQYIESALDEIENALQSLQLEERDCYQLGFSSEGLRIANIGAQIGAAVYKIKDKK